MKKILQNRIALIPVIVLSVFLVSCGGKGSSSSNHSGPSACIDYNDFNDNTLGPWTATGTSGYNVSVTNGAVHMTAPASISWSPPSSVSISRSVSLSGDFVVALDTTEQAADGLEWRHQLTLKVDNNNNIGFMDGDAAKLYQPGWIVFQVINGVSSELFSDVPNYQGGVENVPTTMKIKKVGTTYTFSIVRNNSETVVTTLNIPEFSSYSGVSLNAWAHLTPVDILADNFRVWSDTSAASCNP